MSNDKDLLKAIEQVENELKSNPKPQTQTEQPTPQTLNPQTQQVTTKFNPMEYSNHPIALIGNGVADKLIGIEGTSKKLYWGESLAGTFDKYLGGNTATPEGSLAVATIGLLGIYIVRKLSSKKERNNKERKKDITADYSNFGGMIKDLLKGTEVLGHGM